MKQTKSMWIAQSAIIAALYVVITVVLAPFGFGEVQLRVSEALTILPVFTPAAIPGLFIGCLLGNLLGGGIILDVLVGTIATLIGAIGTYMLRRYKYIAPIAPILANTILVPFVLKYGYNIPLPIPMMMLTVGIGEVLSCGVLGIALMKVLEKSGVFVQSHVLKKTNVL